MLEKETLEARRLHGQKATEFENEVTKLVRRWKYLLKLDWDIEVVAVKRVPPQFDFCDASIAIDNNRKGRLEITMLDRHSYELEKTIVHELLHLPFLELEHQCLSKLPKRTRERIQEESISSGLGSWDEVLVNYWAETLVCLAHGFYPSYGAPPQDDFFAPSHRIPLDLRIQRDTTGDYRSPALRVPMSELKRIYDNYKMSGLL